MRFYFHYNKPASAKANKPMWSVHSKLGCMITDTLLCDVPITSRQRKTQPHAVMTGNANNIDQKLYGIRIT